MSTSENDADEFKADLLETLTKELGEGALHFEAFDRRGEGYSWETYLVTVRTSAMSAPQRFAVKREPRAGLLGTYDVQLEVDLLEAARVAIGCPAPRVIAYRVSTDDRRGYYVMEMVDGIVPMPWDVRKVLPDNEVRRNLGLELAGLMAKIHAKPVAELSIGHMVPSDDPRDVGALETAKWRDIYLESVSERVPVLDLAFAWLAHRSGDVSGRIALVHSDLRVGNVIVKDGRVAAVLDWETARYSDPAADLAVFNSPLFRGRSSLAGGLIDSRELVEAYETAGGWHVPAEALTYWTILEIAKSAVGTLRGRHYFDTGKTDDIRYANMGFQTHHQIRWLVDLYENGQWGRYQ